MEIVETNTTTTGDMGIPVMPSSSIQSLSKTMFTNTTADTGKCAKKYVCKLCSSDQQINSFDWNAFRCHIDTHLATTRPYICVICGKQFPFRSTLRNHCMAHMVVRDRNDSQSVAQSRANTKTSQYGITLYWCNLCPYYCREWSKLERHQRMHFGIKPFKCPECSYDSYDKTKIRRHYVTHTREKPFRCSKCNSTFTQSGSLKSHLSRVHKMGFVSFQCGYCRTYGTSNLGELRSHVKTIHGNVNFTYAIAN